MIKPGDKIKLLKNSYAIENNKFFIAYESITDQQKSYGQHLILGRPGNCNPFWYGCVCDKCTSFVELHIEFIKARTTHLPDFL